MALTTVRETERKYDADAGFELPGLSTLVAGGGVVGPQEQRLQAVYFDTPDFALARAGMTLRHRSGGQDDGWTLKLPAGPDSRDEVQVAGASGKRPPPDELTALVRSVARDVPLAPVATIITLRRQWRLTDADGQDRAEVVDDEVTATTGDEEPRSWREIEVELAGSGDPELLDRVERRLVDAGVRRADAPSKLARALGGRLPAPEPAPQPDGTSPVGEVVQVYLREQAAAIRRNDPYVRRQTPDAVHQMRVASRRLRSALQVFGQVVERDNTRHLTDELKWLAGVLGTARDLEVLRERLTRAVDELPDELVLGPVKARLTRYFAPREADAHTELVTALDGPRYLALLDALDGVVAHPPFTERAAQPASAALPRLLRRAYRRVERHMAAAGQAEADRDTELHEARKAAKRLRYAAEAATPALGTAPDRLVTAVKSVQQILGDRQDAVVARPVLREITLAAHHDGENAFTYGLLHGQEMCEAHHADDEVRAAWRKVGRRLRALVD